MLGEFVFLGLFSVTGSYKPSVIRKKQHGDLPRICSLGLQDGRMALSGKRKNAGMIHCLAEGGVASHLSLARAENLWQYFIASFDFPYAESPVQEDFLHI